MALDPNWFYSTMAQSTAAIVGLAGGFLVQRILAQRSEVAEDHRNLRSSAEGFLRLARNERKRAAEVADALKLAVAEVEQATTAGVPSIRLDVYDFFLLTHGQGYTAGQADRRTPPAIPQDVLPNLRDSLEAVIALRDSIPTTLAQLGPMLVRTGSLEAPTAQWLQEQYSEPPEEWGGVEPANIWEWVPRQRDVARQMWRGLDGEVGSVELGTARGLASRLTVLRERLVPASFWWLWGILVGLLVTSLIIPMTYLSARTGVSKARLTAAFGLLSLAFLTFIAYELLRLRRAGDLSRETF